jgi:hypothetical protein
VANEENIAKHKWQPGVSGNPAGRPKKQPITTAYRDRADEPIPEEMRTQLNIIVVNGVRKNAELLKPGATWADAIALGQAQKAVAGDATSAKEFADRIEGKAVQRLQIEDYEYEMVQVFETAVEARQEKALEANPAARLIDTPAEHPQTANPKTATNSDPARADRRTPADPTAP